jgi:glycosyltransferase involved in cell wall biosynthesis
MKIITLVPVKNESWILPSTLKNFSSFSDHIIVADQNSTDNTLEICSAFEKVHVIKNIYKGHTNQIRWDLLDAARNIEGDGNLIIYLDADELISPHFIDEIKKNNPKGGSGFSSNWIQLLHSYNNYRVDGVWKNNSKQFAFIDDRILDYNRSIVTNDHSNRIPELKNIAALTTPILHLQYLAQKRCEIKQAFYMCNDYLHGKDPRRLNNQYSVVKFTNSTPTEKVTMAWLDTIELPPIAIFEIEDTIKKEDLNAILDKHGITFFEPLDIWHIDDLRKKFISAAGRQPVVKNFPIWLIKLNEAKNKLKHVILAK